MSFTNALFFSLRFAAVAVAEYARKLAGLTQPGARMVGTYFMGRA